MTDPTVTQEEHDLLQYLTDDELEDVATEFHGPVSTEELTMMVRQWERLMEIARQRRRDQSGSTETTPA